MVLAIATAAAQQHPVAFGFQAGIGGSLTTGSLHDNFAGAVNFTAGLNAQWRHWVIKADVDYSQPSFNRINMFARYDDQGRDAQINAAAHASLVGLNVQLGHTFATSRRVSITPATGIRWSHYSWGVNDIEWSKNDDGLDVFKIKDSHHATLSNVNWMASVAVDIKLHDRYIADAPFTDGQARYTSSVRLTPWVARATFSKCTPSVSGCMVGLSLTYAGLFSRL